MTESEMAEQTTPDPLDFCRDGLGWLERTYPMWFRAPGGIRMPKWVELMHDWVRAEEKRRAGPTADVPGPPARGGNVTWPGKQDVLDSIASEVRKYLSDHAGRINALAGEAAKAAFYDAVQSAVAEWLTGVCLAHHSQTEES